MVDLGPEILIRAIVKLLNRKKEREEFFFHLTQNESVTKILELKKISNVNITKSATRTGIFSG